MKLVSGTISLGDTSPCPCRPQPPTQSHFLYLQFLAVIVILFPFLLQLADLAVEPSHEHVMFLLELAELGLLHLQAELQDLDVLLLEPQLVFLPGSRDQSKGPTSNKGKFCQTQSVNVFIPCLLHVSRSVFYFIESIHCLKASKQFAKKERKMKQQNQRIELII